MVLFLNFENICKMYERTQSTQVRRDIGMIQIQKTTTDPDTKKQRYRSRYKNNSTDLVTKTTVQIQIQKTTVQI